MKLQTHALVLLSVLLSGALCVSGLAVHQEIRDREETEEPAWGKTFGNVSLTSDYVIRGQSQTEHQPAIQGGLDWNQPLGFYLGAWGSNVHFPEAPGTAMELDLYGGYTYLINHSWSLSAGVLYYSFFKSADINTWDFPFRVGWKDLKLGVNYSPRWGGQDGHVWYLTGGWSDKLFWDVTLGASLGYSIAAASQGFQNYFDFRLDASREILGVQAGVSAVFVNKRQFKGADDPRLILSVSKTF